MVDNETEDLGELVRLRLVVHTARLVDARKQKGLSQMEMGCLTGIRVARISGIEQLKLQPTEDEMVKMACVLEQPIDYIFPETLEKARNAGVFDKRERGFGVQEVNMLTQAQESQLLSTGSNDLDAALDRESLSRHIDDALSSSLTPRERRILRLRFGLEDGRCRTMEDIGLRRKLREFLCDQ